MTNEAENTWTVDALQRDDVDIIENRVLTEPGYLHERDFVGDTPLLAAIGYDHLRLVNFLLDNGADPNVSVDDGYTCLLVATESEAPNSIAILEALLRAGADIHLTGISGSSPLHMAAGQGAVEKARILIAAGARVNQRKEIDGSETPLMEAAFTGQPGTVQLLLDSGADASMRDSINNRTPLEIARVAGAGADPEVHNYLKQSDLQLDVRHMFENAEVSPDQRAMIEQSLKDFDMAEIYLENASRLVDQGDHDGVVRILSRES